MLQACTHTHASTDKHNNYYPTYILANSQGHKHRTQHKTFSHIYENVLAEQ